MWYNMCYFVALSVLTVANNWTWPGFYFVSFVVLECWTLAWPGHLLSCSASHFANQEVTNAAPKPFCLYFSLGGLVSKHEQHLQNGRRMQLEKCQCLQLSCSSSVPLRNSRIARCSSSKVASLLLIERARMSWLVILNFYSCSLLGCR